MDTESPYSPFNRHHRGTEAPQSSARTPIPRKAPPPPSDLGLPNASFLQDLTGSFRNSVTDPPGAPSESVDYEEDEHSNAWGSGSQGLTNGATAAGFYSLAQKVTSSMTSLTSGHQPEPHRQLSNAEIEAEAIREREHSRREAERILLQEAEERRRSEDLLAQQGHVSHLPPLKPRRSTIDVLPPQPGMIGGSKPNSPGQKSGWWSMAKQKLTPNKSQDRDEGPLTPSQAIARDAKMRERESESPTDEEPQDAFRNRKQSWFSPKGKGKDRSDTDLGASPSALPLPISPPAIPQRLSTSPARLVSPMTPPRVPEASQTTQLNFSPTPAPRTSGARPLVERTPTKAPTLASETPSLYTQFHPITGALDVAATLLTVTARFEKLERWTVNHVRALEDRMKDVERFLVEKETKEADVKRNLSLLRHNIADVELHLTEASGALPAAVLANLLVPGSSREPSTSQDTLGASPSSHEAADSLYYSATGSPSIVPYGGFEPASRPASAPREQAVAPNHHAKERTDDTLKVEASPGRRELPALPTPSVDPQPRNSYNYPSSDPFTPPSRSALSLVSSSGSPILPPPRAVSPLALSPQDLEESRSFSNDRMPSPSGLRERSATSPLDRSYTASPSVSGTIPAPMLAAPQLLASPAPSPPGSRSSSRGNSISPTPRKRYTVALSGRPDGATSPARSPSSASISPTTSRDKDGRISPFPEPKGDDIVERVYGIGLSSTSLSSAAAATATAHPPIAATSSSAEGLSAQTQVHNAMVTPTSPMTPSFNFDSTTSLTNSLAASLKTPETVGKSSRRKWVAPATDSETESDSTSPSTSNFGHSSGAATTEISPNSSMTASSVSTGSAPSDDKEREAPKAKMRSYEHLPSVPPVEEVTEPEEEDDVAVKLEDDDDDGSLFKVGTTPIAFHRITSPPTSPTPPPKASPQPLGSSRTRTQTLPALKGTTSGGSTVTSQRKYPLPERSASPSKSSMASIPRSFGGLPPSVRERGVNQDSVSSMASAASTSTSTSSMITSSSGVTSSSVMSESGRSTSGASSASGSYRTPANNSPPNVRSSTYSTSSYNTAPSTANGRDRDQRGANPRPRALTTNTVVPSSAAGSSNTTLRHTPASPPFSAASLRSTPGSPTYGSDRDRSDLDVFSSRSSTFVDPLLVRRRERERQSMEVKANAMAVAKNATTGRGAGKKPPVGELVAFFQAARD